VIICFDLICFDLICFDLICFDLICFDLICFDLICFDLICFDFEVFFKINCLKDIDFSICVLMSTTTPDNNYLEQSEKFIDKDEKRKITKAPRSNTRKKETVRAPGRPHKRLESEILKTRTFALQKKLQVLLAKKTLIAERLEAYEAESLLRRRN
jgi:hypothetical protein